MPDTARTARSGSSQRHVRIPAPEDAGPPHRLVVSPLEGCSHVLRSHPQTRRPALPRPDRARSAGRPLRRVRARPRLRRRGLGGGSRAYGRHCRARAPPQSLRRARRPGLRRLDRRRPGTARLPLRPPALRGHRSRPHLGSQAAPARVSVPPLDADRQHRAGARRLRPLPGCTAAAREPGLRRHRQQGHGPEPQLRPARQLLQPDRCRAEPPLRLRPDRRRRARPARPVPLAPPARRRLSRADAADHRRHRQPLHLRRGRRWSRRRSRLARRLPAAGTGRRAGAAPAPQKAWTPHSAPSRARAA